ncbi:hypothetical protein B0H12DRAFT_957140, partial [Mycena haematopus]
MHIGLLSDPTPLISAIDMRTVAASLQPASITQAVAHTLLCAWGINGFIADTRRVSDLYR